MVLVIDGDGVIMVIVMMVYQAIMVPPEYCPIVYHVGFISELMLTLDIPIYGGTPLPKRYLPSIMA